MAKKIFVLCFVLVLCVLWRGSASADEFHYNNLLIGDRAAGMGGAYTAISDDATGLYYNPAGIVYSSGRNLSASVNAYCNLNKDYDSVIGGNGWKRHSSALLPNYFGIVQPVGNWKFGFSYAVPDSIQEDQDQTFTNPPLTGGAASTPVSQYVINFNNQDTTYNVGPTIAREITKNLSTGLTLYFFKKDRQTILNQIITLTDNKYQWANDYYERNETGLKPVLGFMWSPVDKLSFGLAVSKVIILSSTTTRQYTAKDFDFTTTQLTRNVITTDVKRVQPLQVSVGAAYFATSNLLLDVDATYYSAVTDPNFGDRNAVVNGALGLEYYLEKSWAVRAGLFSNMANTPEIQAGVLSAEEHVNMYGGSLSISHFTRNTSVTLGGSYSYGSGQAQITEDVSKVQNAEISAWMLYLSSTYSY